MEEESPKSKKIYKKNLHPETKKSIWLLIFLALFFIFILSAFHLAGPAGETIFSLGSKLFGVGYYLLPLTFLIIAITLVLEKERDLTGFSLLGAIGFIFFSLGGIDIVSEGDGGIVGNAAGSIKYTFGVIGGMIITITLIVISLLVVINRPLRVFGRKKEKEFTSQEEGGFEIIMPEG